MMRPRPRFRRELKRVLPLVAVAAICGCSGIGWADPPAAPAPPVPTQAWMIGDTEIGFTPVPIAFPLKAGILTATNHKEASHPGENLDNVIEYWSSDRAVWASVYIYYPGLAHAGLAAIAQDRAIRNYSPQVTGGEMRLAEAGGVERAAIRASYDHYQGSRASEAAFVKAGRWLVTIRISGPEQRQPEIDAAMEALLHAIIFGRAAPAHPPSLITVSDCAPAADEKPARVLPDPQGASIAAYGFLGTFDGGGNAATDGKTGAATVLAPRVPTEMCSASLSVKERSFMLLRGADGDPLSIDGRTVRLVLLSDSGEILEVDHARNLGGYVMLYHNLGETDLLGLYDGIPSDKQLAAILDGSDREGSRIRVPVHFRAGRGPEMVIPGLPSAKPSPARAQPPAASSR